MRFKVGIIGLGVGESHIQGYLKHSKCEVVALCDIDSKKVTQARIKYPQLKVTANSDDILENPNIDVVSIASYDNFHFEQIVKAIRHNKHVFVEKPFCLYEHQARTIRKLLDQNKHLRISSNLILRQCPRFMWLKKHMDHGKLGVVFHLEGDYHYGRLHKVTNGWRGKIDFYSVVYGGGVHLVDLLLWLTKDQVVEVSAYGNNIASRGSKFRYNDSVTAILKLKSGMTAKVSVHFGNISPHFHRLSVFGTKATFINAPEAGKLFESRDAAVKCKLINEDYPGVHKGDLIFNFMESIFRNKHLKVSLDEMFASMSVCFAIEKSVAINKPVKVKYI